MIGEFRTHTTAAADRSIDVKWYRVGLQIVINDDSGDWTTSSVIIDVLCVIGFDYNFLNLFRKF